MGKRGEGWVIGQFVIGAAIFGATFVTRIELPFVIQLVGIALMFVGAGIAAMGIFHLGENLTPFPKPKDDGHALVTGGAYAIVRHPIYSGIGLAALGWTLYWGTLLGIALALILFVWFDFKSRAEEKWLAEKYPEYAAYQTRVKKLIPFVY